MTIPDAVIETIDTYGENLSSHVAVSLYYSQAVKAIRNDRFPGQTDEARGMFVACLVLRRSRSDNKIQTPLLQSEATNQGTKTYIIHDPDSAGGLSRNVLASNDAGRDLLMLIDSTIDEPIITR